MTRGEFRDSTSRYMCTIPIVFIQYCCSSLPVVAVGSAYSRSLRVAAPLGTITRTRARAARTTRAPAALCVWNGPVRPRRDDPVCRENGYILVKTDIYY